MKTIDITPFNDKGQENGYWEIYDDNGNLFYKGNYINGKPFGLWEEYYYGTDIPHYKGYYTNGKMTGYWEMYHNNGDLAYKKFIIL